MPSAKGSELISLNMLDRLHLAMNARVNDPMMANASNISAITAYALVSRQSSRVAKFMMYYIHNQPRRIGYEEVHCCTF